MINGKAECFVIFKGRCTIMTMPNVYAKKSYMLALEPRVMFDAAAVTTAAVVAQDSKPQADAAAAEHEVPAQATVFQLGTLADGLSGEVLFTSLQTNQDSGIVNPVGGLDYQGIVEVDIENVDDNIRAIGSVSQGDYLYVLVQGSSYEWQTDTDRVVSAIQVFQRDDDGQMTRVQSLDSRDHASMAGALAVQVSTDGRSLYVLGDQAVSLFDIDSGGNLTFQSSISESQVGDQMIRAIQTVNERLYVTAGNSLYVFNRIGGNVVEAFQYSEAGQLDNAGAMVASANGDFLFVATSGSGGQVSAFRIDTATGSLSFTGSSAQSGSFIASGLALSEDGRSLYVTVNNGRNYQLQHVAVDVDSGALTNREIISMGAQITSVAISKDGGALFAVQKNQIALFLRQDDGAVRKISDINGFGDDPFDFDYIQLNNLSHASFSADGQRLLVAGQAGWGDRGVLILDLSAARSRFVEGESPVAILPNALLVNPARDAADDYNGASLTVARVGGAQPGDIFGFLDNGDLTLTSGQILRAGTAVANFSVDASGVLTVTFISAISKADAQRVLQGVSYSSSSKDPTRDGSKLTFNISLDQAPALEAGLDITPINDPAVVTVEALTPTFREQGEPVRLFRDTVIDTVEANQEIWRVDIRIDGINEGDVLYLDGTAITFGEEKNYPNSLPGGAEYRVLRQGSSWVVALYVLGSPQSSGEATAQLIDGLRYANEASGIAGRSLTVGLVVNEWLDGMDGENQTTVLERAVITLAEPLGPNTSPILGGDTPVAYTEGGAPVLLMPEGIVSDAEMDAFNEGQGNFNGSELVITLGEGRSSLDRLGFQPGQGLSLDGTNLLKDGRVIGTMTFSDGVLRVTFSDGAGQIPLSSDAQNVLRQITYSSTEKVPAERIAVTLMWRDQVGAESTPLGFDILVTPVNDAPVLDRDPVLSLGELAYLESIGQVAGLRNFASSAFSADGANLYVLDSTGAVAWFQRDATSGTLTYAGTLNVPGGLRDASQLQVSQDGSKVFTLSKVGNGTSAIHTFSRVADGSLEYIGGYDTTYFDANRFAVSADGRFVYLIERNSSNVVVFESGSNGTLTPRDNGPIRPDMRNPPYLWQPTNVVVQGDRVFVTTDTFNGATLIVFQRDPNTGALSAPSYIHGGERDAAGNVVELNNLRHVVASQDGRTIYVASDTRVDGFSLDPVTGGLTHLGTVHDGQAVRGIAMSPDGRALFVTLADGSLQYYATATGQLQGSRGDLTGAGQIVVTADGGIVVLGQSVFMLSAADAPAPVFNIGVSDAVVLFPDLRISDIELDAAASGQGNYGGASLEIRDGLQGGVFGFATGDQYILDGSNIVGDGQVIATFTLAADGTTLTITFAQGTTSAQANAVLRQITYAWQGDNAPGRVTLSLSFNDGSGQDNAESPSLESVVVVNTPPVVREDAPPVWQLNAGSSLSLGDMFRDPDGDTLTFDVTGALPPGIRFDATTGRLSGTVTTAGVYSIMLRATDPNGMSVTHEVTIQVASVPPTVDLSATDAVFTENGTPVAIFENVEIDVNGAGELVTELVFQVENVVNQGDEQIIIDGTAIVLRAGASGVTQSGHAYTVRAVDGGLQLTLTAGQGLQATQAAALLAGMRYFHTSDNPTVDQPRTIMLTSVRDDGTTTGGGSNTTLVGVTSTIRLIAVNDAPRAVVGELFAPEVPQRQTYDYVLPSGLFVDPEGDSFTITVEGLPAGLVFDPATGRISGTPDPSVGGVFSVRVIATDVYGAQGSLILQLSVEPLLEGTPLSQQQPDRALANELRVNNSISSIEVSRETESELQRRLRLFGLAGSTASETRPLGAVPLSSPLAINAVGVRGLPFYINEWQVQDSGQNESQSPALGNRLSSALIGGGDRAGLHANRDSVQGTAQWNAEQSRYQFQLPEGVFSGRQQVAAVVLAQADGASLPEGISLDRQSGRILVSSPEVTGRLDLVLIAQTRDGRTVAVPVTLDIPGEGSVTQVDAGKPAISAQLEAHSSQSLNRQAEALLSRLGETVSRAA